jgi:hypothetical protein
MYMGDYIVIDHMIGPFEFACESVSTGTPFHARVDDDKKRDLFRLHISGSPSLRLPVPPPVWRSSPLHDSPGQSAPVQILSLCGDEDLQ